MPAGTSLKDLGFVPQPPHPNLMPPKLIKPPNLCDAEWPSACYGRAGPLPTRYGCCLPRSIHVLFSMVFSPAARLPADAPTRRFNSVGMDEGWAACMPEPGAYPHGRDPRVDPRAKMARQNVTALFPIGNNKTVGGLAGS